MTNEQRMKSALEAATETKALEIGVNNLSGVAKMFQEQFPGKRAIIIADPNTYKAAGAFVLECFQSAGISCDQPYLFTAEDLHAEYTFVEELDQILQATDAIAVAVGSGTINDLVKLSSGHRNTPYMCVATAASVDGYTSYGASITYKGSKQTFQCPAPQAVLADVKVMITAPFEMTAAGYADLVAKVPAGADWIISDVLGVDPIHKVAYGIVQDGLKEAISNPQGVLNLEPEAIASFVEGLMLSGFAMQASRTSRPASGADHMFSHYWDMQHHTHNGETPSHGFKVSIGTLATCAMYEELFRYDMSKLDVNKAVSQWPDLDTVQKHARALFANTDFPELGFVEMTAKYSDKEEVRHQLETIKKCWNELYPVLREQVNPYDEIAGWLKVVSAPVNPEEIGISRPLLKHTYECAMHLRRRFTVLDLVNRMACFPQMVDHIFSADGVWPIR